MLVLTLPVLCVVGIVVAGLLDESAFEPVDLSNPPRNLAVLGAWDDVDGELTCRAFYYADLVEHAESLPPLRFRVSPDELRTCSASFHRYGDQFSWSHEFDWDKSGFAVAVHRPDPKDPDLFVVAYRSDDDYVADTRYRLDPATGNPAEFEFRGYFGPGRALQTMSLGIVGGTIGWLLMAVFILAVRIRRGSYSD